MISGARVVFLATASVLLFFVGLPAYQLVIGGYRFRDSDAPAGGGPLNFDNWRVEIKKQRPSLLDVKLENDLSNSFAFFFDKKMDQLVVCWYGSQKVHGNGNYGLSVDAPERDKADSVYSPPINFTVRYASSLWVRGGWSYSTGDFIQIRKPDVKNFSFEFSSHFQGKESISDFVAERRGPDVWVVKKQ